MADPAPSAAQVRTSSIIRIAQSSSTPPAWYRQTTTFMNSPVPPVRPYAPASMSQPTQAQVFGPAPL